MNIHIISLISLLKLKDEKLNLFNKNIEALKKYFIIKVYLFGILKKTFKNKIADKKFMKYFCFRYWKIYFKKNSKSIKENFDIENHSFSFNEVFSVKRFDSNFLSTTSTVLNKEAMGFSITRDRILKPFDVKNFNFSISKSKRKNFEVYENSFTILNVLRKEIVQQRETFGLTLLADKEYLSKVKKFGVKYLNLLVENRKNNYSQNFLINLFQNNKGKKIQENFTTRNDNSFEIVAVHINNSENKLKEFLINNTQDKTSEFSIFCKKLALSYSVAKLDGFSFNSLCKKLALPFSAAKLDAFSFNSLNKKLSHKALALLILNMSITKINRFNVFYSFNVVLRYSNFQNNKKTVVLFQKILIAKKLKYLITIKSQKEIQHNFNKFKKYLTHNRIQLTNTSKLNIFFTLLQTFTIKQTFYKYIFFKQFKQFNKEEKEIQTEKTEKNESNKYFKGLYKLVNFTLKPETEKIRSNLLKWRYNNLKADLTGKTKTIQNFQKVEGNFVTKLQEMEKEYESTIYKLTDKNQEFLAKINEYKQTIQMQNKTIAEFEDKLTTLKEVAE
jgi:hypothetical protein